MPNWCSNRATISGPAPVIKEITDILNQEDTPLLAWMVPEPKYEGDQDWYMWRVNAWGTKWDIGDVYFEHNADEDQIQFEFSSPWGPPTQKRFKPGPNKMGVCSSPWNTGNLAWHLWVVPNGTESR
jgi:hypothetical protein